MAVALKKRRAKAASKTPNMAARQDAVLYLYGISLPSARALPNSVLSVDGRSIVEVQPIDDFRCWFSRVDRIEYADQLANNMENLEWLAEASIRHQQAVAEFASRVDFIPARFGTVFLTENSLREHVVARRAALKAIFKRIHGSAEWGVKVFREEGPPADVPVAAKSGREYLQRKADAVRPAPASSPALEKFGRDMQSLSVAAASGGKASVSQPGLVWHRSFLLRNSDHSKFMALLKRGSRDLAGEFRIECSGPWPPYSFVDEHGN